MKFMFTSIFAVSLFAVFQLGFSSNNDSWRSKLGVSLERFQRSETQDVLVLLQGEADLSQAQNLISKEAKGRYVVRSLRATADRSQKDLVEWLKANGLEHRQFYILNAISVKNVSQKNIEQLAKRDDVRKIIADPAIKQKEITSRNHRDDSQSAPEGVGENIVSTGAKAVWDMGFKGEGIVVAGQDTGVDWTHPALVNHYRGSSRGNPATHDYNWHDSIHDSITGTTNKCGLNLSAPCDDDQHGTHTMGTMVGSDGGENQIGMAPDAKWIACRNMDAGTGRPSTYLECYEWLLAPYPFGADAKQGDPKFAPNVINNSWGCPAEEGCEGSEMIPMLKAISAAGIMNVVSAGNDGPGCGTIQDQPADVSEYTFSVGAHNHRTNLIAGFSSRGPSALDGKLGPDITAPGVSVRSSVPGGGYEDTFWSGTSMAGPHVAGAVALLWSAQPKLVGDIQKTVDLLRSTAIPTQATDSCGGVDGSLTPNNTYGYGRLDVQAAVKKALML